MRPQTARGAAVAIALGGVIVAFSAVQRPTIRPIEENILREYNGVYQWQPGWFMYLQMWHEFSGFDKPSQLVSFDESGDVRVLYPSDRDRFFTGSSAAVPTTMESRIEFQRDAGGGVVSLTWARKGSAARTAQRVEIETREETGFANGDVQLAGTLFSPASKGKHPAIILVHGSGPENREHVLPWARFLVRRGMAVLAVDKPPARACPRPRPPSIRRRTR